MPQRTLLALAISAALAMPLAAQLQFEQLPRMGLPEIEDSTRTLAFGDVDGDGDLDLVCCSWDRNRLYVNDGTGMFTDVTAVQMPAAADSTTSLALGDVDGDGDLDLLLGNFGHQNRLCLNDGTGTFVDATAGRMPVLEDRTTSIALGDVDGDGDLDLVCGAARQCTFPSGICFDGQDRLCLNDGTGTFADVTASRMPLDDSSNTAWVSLGDVDNDGDVDIVTGNNSEQNRLYRNDGTGTFVDVTVGRMPVDDDETTTLALGDVDGDGDIDIVVGNRFPGQDRLYLNDGTGTFADVTASRMPVDDDHTMSVALGDVDGDGDLDVVMGNALEEPNRLLLNDGTGSFSDVTSSRLPMDQDATLHVALGDVDDDGDLDLVAANDYLPNNLQNRLYLNLQRHLYSPAAPQLGQPYGIDAYMRHGTSTVANIALPYLSLAPASVPAPPFGTIGIDLARAAAYAPFIVQAPAGVSSSLGFVVPNHPTLLGQVTYSQALLIAYPFDIRLSNVVVDPIQ